MRTINRLVYILADEKEAYLMDNLRHPSRSYHGDVHSITAIVRLGRRQHLEEDLTGHNLEHLASSKQIPHDDARWTQQDQNTEDTTHLFLAFAKAISPKKILKSSNRRLRNTSVIFVHPALVKSSDLLGLRKLRHMQTSILLFCKLFMEDYSYGTMLQHMS